MRTLLLAGMMFVALLGASIYWLLATDIELRLFSLSAQDVVAYAEAWAPWSMLASMALMILHSFLPFPSEVIAIANGMMFGPVTGIAVTWSSAMIGAVLAFALARHFGRPVFRGVFSDRLWQVWDRWEPDAGTLLVVRLIPVISFNLINYAAGLARVDWWPFLWTTGLGILPLTVATALFGYGLIGTSWPVVTAIVVGGVLIALALRRVDMRGTIRRFLPKVDDLLDQAPTSAGTEQVEAPQAGIHLESTLTCPQCGFRAIERMPTDACQFFYDCKGCGTRLKPLPGDCCVFCSYGSVSCPPVQQSGKPSCCS